MVAVEEVLEEVDNRVTHGIGGRLGIAVGLKGGVEAREPRVGAVVEAGVGLAAAAGGLVEHRSVELRRHDVVATPRVEGGDGAQRKGLQFRLRQQVDVDTIQVLHPNSGGDMGGQKGRMIDGVDARHLHSGAHTVEVKMCETEWGW